MTADKGSARPPVMTARAPNEERRPIRQWFARFPVLLVSWTLIWAGVIGQADPVVSAISSISGSLISLHCSIVFLLCGSAMLTAQRRPTASRILALLSLGLCLYCFAHGMAGMPSDSASPFGPAMHISGAWAVLLAVLSAAIACCMLGKRGRMVARVLGGGVIAGAIALRFSSQWALMANASTANTGNLTMFLGIMGGGAVLGLSFRELNEAPFLPRRVAITGVVGTLIAVLAWYAITIEDRHRTVRHAEVVSDRIAYVVQNTISAQKARVARMAERWSLLVMPPRQLVTTELQSYLKDAPALDMVAAVDANYRMRWVAGNPQTQDWIAQALQRPRFQAWLKHTYETGQAHFKSQSIDGANLVGALTAAPLKGPILEGWTILTVHNLPQLLRDVLGKAESSIYFQLRDNTGLLYRGSETNNPALMIEEKSLHLHHDLVWRLSVWQGSAWTHPLAEPLPDLALLVCFIFTFFLTRSQRLTMDLGERSGQLYYGSMHDALTGLPNKKYLVDKLNETFNRAPPIDRLAVVLLDLYGLKLINDSMGHQTGDQVLELVAQRLSTELGPYRFAARLNGDEFVVVLTDLERNAVIEIADRIIAAIAKPYWVQNTELRLASAAGIAFRKESTSHAMQLLREADLAMARAAQDGRNTWCQYSDDLGSDAAKQLVLRNELQKAIENDELLLHYQPVVDGDTGRLAGVEALLRWPHPTRGHLPPSAFIPLAEETGLIIPISLWVLEVACRDIAVLRTRNLPDLRVMVNISPSHFQRSDFIDAVNRSLLKYAVPADCLEIEITEGVLLDNATYVINKLQQLKKLGVKISIDDFGTGYSSLNYLKNLPIDKVKIDRSFVHEVISDRHDAAITRAIIALAHHLGLKVVAEGVETESQYWFLKRNFCDEFQGFLFARPMPLNELSVRLQEQGGHEALPIAPLGKPSDRTLLLLDDEENILRALTRLLRRDGYRILAAKTPEEAFATLATNDVHVIVSDQRMPEMTGTEFFSRVKEMYPTTVRLILSGYTDLRSVTEAINRGAIYKFLTKPWDDQELRDEIAQAFKGAALREADDVQA